MIRATCRRLACFLALLLAAPVVPAMAQESGPELLIQGLDRSIALSSDDLAAMPRDTATVTFRDEETVRFEGVPLHHLLARVGVRTDSLRGPALRQRVIISAADGYEVVFSLAEADPSLPDRRYLLADRANGEPLVGRDAPFRLIIDGDPRHSRWIRQVTSIRVLGEP